MNYGHMKEGKLVKATFPIRYKGRDYFTANPEALLSFGEKKIVYNDKPISDGSGIYTSSWKETDKEIIQEWTFIAYTDEDYRKQYEKAVARYIREKYSVNEEFKILREYSAYGEKTAFDEYNEYVESCKARAYEEVYGEPYTNDESEGGVND